MKKIEAIIRPSALRSVLDGLKAVGYPGVTVAEVQGHGKQKGVTESYRGQSVEGLLPKLLVTAVVGDKQVQKVVNTIIKATRTGEIGDGKIFVSTVAKAIRIRTGEKGDKAL
ncbi:MAG TPA: P-II family nitrogen regulator [bacterium]|nr:P-II family nitrogen regulator [bacterium]